MQRLKWHCHIKDAAGALYRIYTKRVLNAAMSDCQQFVERSNGFRSVKEWQSEQMCFCLSPKLQQWVGGSCRWWQTAPGLSCRHHRKRPVVEERTSCRQHQKSRGVWFGLCTLNTCKRCFDWHEVPAPVLKTRNSKQLFSFCGSAVKQETCAVASKTARCEIYRFPPILIDKYR